MPLWGFAALMLFLTGGLLVGERRKSQALKWLFKPLNAAAFLAAALSFGALGSPYGVALLVALALSWWGDVLLIPYGQGRAFLVGILSFLMAHLAFGVAFVVRGVEWGAVGLASGALAVAGAVVLRWLLPQVRHPFKLPVVAYTCILSLMVALAVGAWWAGAPHTLLVAALMFYASDLSVALDRFVQPSFFHRLWGMPTYFGAQLLFAATLLPP